MVEQRGDQSDTRIKLRVKLGDCWKEVGVSVHGGQPLERAEVMGVETSTPNCREIDVNQDLSYSEREAMYALLEKHSKVFAVNPKRPDEVKTTRHRITLLDERPIKHRPLRVSPKTEREVARQIDEMSRNEIIRPSDSPWGSRIILVRKKDGNKDLRLITPSPTNKNNNFTGNRRLLTFSIVYDFIRRIVRFTKSIFGSADIAGLLIVSIPLANIALTLYCLQNL